MKKLKLKDIMNLFLIAVIPFFCFFYYTVYFYKMFAPNDPIGRNVCLIIIGAFLWGMIDIIHHFLVIIREHDHLNRFTESFSPEKEYQPEQYFSKSIIGKRYQTILSLKNSLSDINHHMLTEIISSSESSRTIVARYLMGACVMLGLFGSFLGLLETVGGAYSAIEGIENSGELLNNLSRPLGGMSLTFGTSIMGIIASLSLGFSFIFLNRRQISFLSDLEAFTQITLIPCMGVSSNQKHLDLLDRLKNIEKNTGSLNDIRDTLKQEAGKIFENINGYYSNLTQTIKETLAKTMTDINDNVSSSFSSLTSSTIQSIQDMHTTMETSVAEISDLVPKQIQTFLTDEQKAIEEMLARINVYTEKNSESTQLLGEKIIREFNGFLETERSLVQKMLDQVNTSSQSIMDSNRLLNEKMVQNIHDFLATEQTQIHDMIAHINTTGQTTAESNRLLLTDYALTNQEQMQTFLADTQESCREVMDSFTEKNGQFFQQEIQRTTEDLKAKTSHVIQNALNINKDLFEDNMRLFSNSSETFHSLGLNLQNMHELYSERLNRTTQAIDNAISGFSKTLQQKQHTNEQLSLKNEEITVLLQEVSTLLQSNQSEMQAGLAMFLHGVDNLLTSFQIKAKDQVAEKTMTENLEKALNTLTEKSENVLLEYVAKSREIYSGLLDNQLHLTRKIKELAGDN